MPQALPIIAAVSAVASVGSAVHQYGEAKKARQSQEKQRRVIQKRDMIKQRRERLQAYRERVRAQDEATITGQSTGSGMASSTIQGSIASIGSQFGSNIGFGQEMSGAQTALNEAQYTPKGNIFGTIGTVSSSLGGQQALQDYSQDIFSKIE